MLKDCIEVFKKELDKNGDKLIVDKYIPADGTYIIVEPYEESFKIKEVVEIKLDKKTREIDKSSNYIDDIRKYDYNSKLVSMDKSIDRKKLIHSNNYLSFFVKKENLVNGKLTNEIIDSYYLSLANPYLKYSKPKAKKIYEDIEEDIGEVDVSLLKKIQLWIKENIFNLDIDISGKDYLKIFFEYPIERYEIEGKRYLIPNVYNKNDFNVVLDNKTYGLPNDNMGLNAKKPYLENKTRKVKVPHLVNSEEVLVQRKFFDFLMNFAAKGEVNIYIDEEINGYENGVLPGRDFNGVFLRIQKGKEVEIHDFDIITDYKIKLRSEFVLKNILDIDLVKTKSTYKYDIVIDSIKGMKDTINEVLFSKFLTGNYFTEAKDMSINDTALKTNLLFARERLFNWLHKGNISGVPSVLDKASLSLVKGSIENGYLLKASHQFNLRVSLKKYFDGGRGSDMANMVCDVRNNLRLKINESITGEFESDEEYYYAVGQLVNYFLSKSKGNKKLHSLANPFFNAGTSQMLNQKLKALFKKYNYDIEMNSKRFNNLYGMIVGYNTEAKVDQDMILAGYLQSSLIYESNKSNGGEK